MNYESASYKRYKEVLPDKTYVDYVMADGEEKKLFSVNYPNTIGYQQFVEARKDDILKEISDIDSVVDIVKYIEFDQMSKAIQTCHMNVELRGLAIRHLRVSMRVNTNVSIDDVKRIDKLLCDIGMFIHTTDILDYDSTILPVSNGVRYTTLKLTETSLDKAGISKKDIQEFSNREYENRVLVSMILLFRNAGLKVNQFYGTSYFIFKGMLFTYKFSYEIDMEDLYKFIDSFEHMFSPPAKFILCMYNGSDKESEVYKGVTISVKNISTCMDKYVIEGKSFTKSFKS